MNSMILNKLVYQLMGRINRRRYSFLSTPGMMGYDERMNLYKVCSSELVGTGCAVELGSFFGASTGAIQQGLKRNNSTRGRTEFHVVDCFRSSLTSEFSALVREYACQGHVGHLLSEEDGWLNFYESFSAHIDPQDPLVNIHRSFLSDLEWESRPVEFLHLDLPKDWKQASFVASVIFPDLVVGAKVLFQDFGYQWSGELIGMIGILVDMGVFKPYRLTDTTLSINVKQRISAELITILKQKMSLSSEIVKGIENARVACQYLLTPATEATLSMAMAQYKYSLGDIAGCFDIISSILLDPSCDYGVRVRLADFFQKRFVMDKSYEKKSDITEDA